jgi:hypothetical protein
MEEKALPEDSVYQKIRRGQVIFPRPDPILATLAMGVDVNPSAFLKQDIIFADPSKWDLVPGYPERLPCPQPDCLSLNTASAGLCTTPFSRTMVTREGEAQVVPHRHVCNDCKRGFLSTDPRVIDQLPMWIQRRLPFFSTWRKMIHRHDKAQIEVDLRTGTSVRMATHRYCGVRGELVAEDHMAYLACVLTLKETHNQPHQPTLETLQEAAQRAAIPWPEHVPDFPSLSERLAKGAAKVSGGSSRRRLESVSLLIFLSSRLGQINQARGLGVQRIVLHNGHCAIFDIDSLGRHNAFDNRTSIQAEWHGAIRWKIQCY